MSPSPENFSYQSNARWPGVLPVLIGAALGAAAYVAAWPIESSWLGRVVLHWPNLLSLMAFGMAVGLVVSRLVNLTRQRRAFSITLLDDDPDLLILPQDALDIRKRLRQLDARKRVLVLIRLLDAGLQRARANWSAEDVGTAVKTEAELTAGNIEAEYSMIRYLAWAIPSIGFIGTVLGIGDALGFFSVEGEAADVSQAAGALSTAFDTTFVALILSLILMYLLHRVQARDDAFMVDATSWCMRRFVYRMHIPTQTSS